MHHSKISRTMAHMGHVGRLKEMPACLRRKSRLRVRLRTSIGSRRRSLEQVESTKRHRVVLPAIAEQVEDGKAACVAGDGFAVDNAGARRQRGDAATASGNRSARSKPLRVMSFTPPSLSSARMRKPSCLISWIQPGPVRRLLGWAGQVRFGPPDLAFLLDTDMPG